jgi:D-alanyl-D-alanine carboxypeptidase/D-alanyl-D-alanine-endopeptidase (penicillin-binding protein 4)
MIKFHLKSQFRRVFLGLMLLFLSIPIILTQQIAGGTTPVIPKLICPAQLGTNINAVIERPEFRRSRWGILVQTLSSKQTLYSQDAEKYFIPASNAKLLTAAVALQQLGENFHIRTSVYQNDPDALVVFGRGDPSLTDIQLQTIVQQLKQKGITKIRQLTIDDSYLQGDIVNPTWEWEDIQSDYGAPVSSFILDENTFSLKLVSSTLGKVPQVIWNDLEEAKQWRIINEVVTVAENQASNIDASRNLFGTELRIRGQIAINSPPYLLNLPIIEPNNYFLQHLRAALIAEKIAVEKIAVVTGEKHQQEIAAIESPSLGKLLTEMNLHSNNIYAEALLRILATKKLSRVNQNSDAIGLEVLKESLSQLGVDPESYILTDGSGLSRKNLLSPGAIVQTLQGIATTENADVYRGSLPVAGKSGTLKNRFQNTSAEGIVQAKTGTMAGVVSLSGYINVPNYDPLVFSIIVNESNQSPKVVRQAMDQIVISLTELKRC